MYEVIQTRSDQNLVLCFLWFLKMSNLKRVHLGPFGAKLIFYRNETSTVYLFNIQISRKSKFSKHYTEHFHYNQYMSGKYRKMVKKWPFHCLDQATWRADLLTVYPPDDLHHRYYHPFRLHKKGLGLEEDMYCNVFYFAHAEMSNQYPTRKPVTQCPSSRPLTDF